MSGADGSVEGGSSVPLGDLATEGIRPELAELDLFDADDLVALMVADARRAVVAVVDAAPSIGAAIDVVVARLRAGGRLIYVGAGTAGRLAVLDAAELGPTFDVPSGVVEAVLAGGDAALRHASEGAEDDRAVGAAELGRLAPGENDAVIGVSASGRTPFVIGALEAARRVGATTIGIACNLASPLAATADIVVELDVGAEVIAGSSRMNAGTAQKIALNTISTSVMVRLGKTFGNLMVDVRPTNEKLRDRARRIVRAVTGVEATVAGDALELAQWNTKLACLIAASGRDLATVSATLDVAGGRLRSALTLLGVAPDGRPVRAGPGRAPGGPASPWRRLGVGAALVDGRLVRGDVAIDDGRVVAVGLPGRGAGIAIAGLVDLQVNGYAGIDAVSATSDELVAMGRALARDGVLAYQPTLISGDIDVTAGALTRLGEVAAGGADRDGARIVGVHLEGPFLSLKRAGTHPLERLIPPNRAILERLLRAGPVTMVTLAAEVPGAIELISMLAGRGVVVSLGHSDATAEEANAAIDAGARAVTHLFNAMPAISARSAGLAGHALADRRVAIQIIADGVHVADDPVRFAFAAAGARCSIVTDATSLAGSTASGLMLGEVPITIIDGVARRPDGTISGGASTLLDGVRYLVAIGLDLDDALAAATERPARLLPGDEIGRLRPGNRADVVVLDDALQVQLVLAGGRGLPDG